MKTLADQVFVISLPERIDRRERVTAVLREENVPFQFMNGIRVRRDEIVDLEIAELYWEDFKIVAGWDAYLKAAIGCKRAHLNCLKWGIDNDVDSLLIMEDDVAFRTGWYPRFRAAVSDLPKGWLQLYLSAGVIQPSMQVSSTLQRLTGACQTTAILYSRDGIEAAWKCTRHARAEIDWWMAHHLHPFGCSYVVDPQITYQTGGYSDCRGTIRGEMP